MVGSYRGPDRRRSARPESGSPFDRSFAVALGVILVAFLIALRPWAPVDPTGLDGEDYLAFGASSVLAVSSVLLIARWRVNRTTTALWAAIANGLIAVTIVVRCIASSEITDSESLRSVGLAFAVVSMAVGLLSAVAPTVDGSVRGVRLLVVPAMTVAGIVFLSVAFIALELGLPAHGGDGAGAVKSLTLTTGWVLLTAAWLWRARKDQDWALGWLGLLALTMALSEVSIAVATAADRPVSLDMLVLLLVGALCAGRGATRALQVAIDVQAWELDETRENMGAADHQAQSARAAAEERAHEARNALQAVGGAIQTLERYHEKLDPSVRSKLADGIAFELERLQKLVDVDETTAPPSLFAVEDAVIPVVEGARGQGMSIDVRIPDDLVAIGNPMATAEVVQNLLINAERHADGVDVVVEASQEAGRVLITVSDGGPGVPHGEREAVFGRRQCGTTSSGGQGFGLYVSRRLVRSQGGELWVADRPGGGAVFGFDLAVASARGLTGQSTARTTPAPDAFDQVGDTADAG